MTNMWILALVTATNSMELMVEHHKMYDFGPRCEYAAEARKTFFPSDYGKQFVCLQVPKQTEHK